MCLTCYVRLFQEEEGIKFWIKISTFTALFRKFIQMNLLSSVQSSTCPTLENLDKVTVTLLILSAAKWTGGFFPFAVRTCPKLKSPENGHINCSTADISYKTVCLVTCNEGYEIEGNTKLTCQGTAQWDSKEPKCVGKYLIKLSLSVSECSIFWHAVTSEKHSFNIWWSYNRNEDLSRDVLCRS